MIMKDKGKKVLKIILIGLKYFSFMVTFLVFISVIDYYYFYKKDKITIVPEVKNNDISIGYNLYKDEQGVYFSVHNSNQKIRIGGMDSTDVRLVTAYYYDGYYNYSNQASEPYIYANNHQSYLVRPSFGKIKDLSGMIKNPQALKKFTHKGPEKTNILTDGIDFYILTYQDIYRLPIDNGVVFPETSYIKSKDAIFYLHKRITSADTATFKMTENNLTGYIGYQGAHSYGQDYKNVYYKGEIVAYADPQTFKTYQTKYLQTFAYDKKYVFYEGKVVDGADPETFVLLGSQSHEGCQYHDFAKDKNNVYYKTQKVIGVDPQTIEILLNGYAKDTTKTFWENINISIPPEELVVECHYG